MFKIGDRVMARIHYSDSPRPATVVDSGSFVSFNERLCYALEFDTNGGYSSRRVAVSKCLVKAM